MPNFGPKQRETKSYAGSSDRAVTTAISNAANGAKSGLTARTALASLSSSIHPMRPFDTAAAAMPSASSRPGSGSAVLTGSAGKSSSTSSPARVAASTPLRVSKRAVSSAARRSVSHRTCALARVAWPHRSTSTVGVNQRSSKCPGSSATTGRTNAVSERFISAATACIHAGSAGASRRHTAAGLPVKGPDANASTWKKGARTMPGLLDDDQHVAGAHRVTGRDADLLHGAAPLGVDVVLHLHRLEHEQRLAGLDGVTLRDEHLHDRALHRRADGAVAAGPSAGRRSRLADLAAPRPAPPGGGVARRRRLRPPHPDREPLAVDLDGDRALFELDPVGVGVRRDRGRRGRGCRERGRIDLLLDPSRRVVAGDEIGVVEQGEV